MLLLLRVGELLGFGVDPACEFVVTTAVHINIFGIIACIRAALARAVAVRVGIVITVLATGGLSLLACLAIGLLGGLVLLALLGCSLQDERGELVAEVGVGVVTASLAVEDDVAILDVDNGLGVLAVLAKDELVDEAVEVVLQLGSLVGTVDNPAVVLGVDVGLGAKLETEVFDDIVRRAGQLVGHVVEVDDDGLDTVALALDLGLDLLHLVTVEGILDVATDVDGFNHDCGVDAGDVLLRDGMIHSGEGCVGCYKVGKRPRRHALFCYKALMVFGIQDVGWQMFVGFFFDARLLQESTVGAVMARKTSCSRYAKWLRLLRRRIECKGVRVGRIHKLWTVYGFLECVGWWWATS